MWILAKIVPLQKKLVVLVLFFGGGGRAMGHGGGQMRPGSMSGVMGVSTMLYMCRFTFGLQTRRLVHSVTKGSMRIRAGWAGQMGPF